MYAVFTPETFHGGLSRTPLFPNFQNGFRLKLGIALSGAAAFCKLISSVVPNCSQEQMVYIYARWIVALVTNKKTFRDRTVGIFPRCPVRPAHLAVYFNGSIAPRRAASPNQTSILSRGRVVSQLASYRAKAGTAPFWLMLHAAVMAWLLGECRTLSHVVTIPLGAYK